MHKCEYCIHANNSNHACTLNDRDFADCLMHSYSRFEAMDTKYTTHARVDLIKNTVTVSGVYDTETGDPVVIPCKRISDDAVGFYNTINEVFIGVKE